MRNAKHMEPGMVGNIRNAIGKSRKLHILKWIGMRNFRICALNWHRFRRSCSWPLAIWLRILWLIFINISKPKALWLVKENQSCFSLRVMKVHILYGDGLWVTILHPATIPLLSVFQWNRLLVHRLGLPSHSPHFWISLLILLLLFSL